jgi:hypothetical protein
MGWFGRSANVRRPVTGSVPQSADQVRLAIMGLNRPDAPFRIRDARDERADLVAEWKIEERRWAALFSAAGMHRATRTLMRLDPVHHEVRSVDQVRAVEWRAGIGYATGSIMWGRGQIGHSYSRITFGRRPGGGFGFVVEDRFSSKQVKESIQGAVTAAGWTWRGVSFGGL